MLPYLAQVFSLIKHWSTTNAFTSTLILGVCVAIFLKWILTRRKNYPPGPTGIPYFGYVSLVCDAPYKLLANLTKKYGKVFSINLGGRPTIVLNDFSSIKEAFSNPVYSGRPPDTVFELFDPEGATLPNGNEWMKIRRFTLHLFRDLGFAKEGMEERMKEEVLQLLKELSEENGHSFSPRRYLRKSVAHNIAVLVLGKQIPRDHVGLQSLSNDVPPSNIICLCGILMFIPFARQIFGLFVKYSSSKMFDVVRAFQNLVAGEIERHKKNRSEDSSLQPQDDYIDGFLTEMEKYKDDDKTNISFTDSTLRSTVQGLMGAGSDTVATSLEWANIIMACNPHIQKRVQDEIDENVGMERIPCWNDHTRLPYTEAVLMEIQRWITLVPINILRSTLADATLQGYDIPEGTVVLANLWAVHHDPQLWDEPEKFMPERFLSPDGKSIVKPEYYIPFSYGKRSCLGEPLAIREIFLYFTAIMQTFTIKFPPGQKADLEGVLAIVLTPKTHELIFTRRDNNRPLM